VAGWPVIHGLRRSGRIIAWISAKLRR